MGVTFGASGITLDVIPLDPEERRLAEAQIDAVFDNLASISLREIQKYKDQVIAFIGAMKRALDGNPSFEGAQPSETGIGIAKVRPAHFRDNAGASLLQSGTTAHGAYLDVSFDTEWKTVASGTLNDDAGIILFGIYDFYDGNTHNAQVDGIKVQVGQRTYVPQDLSDATLKDNNNKVPLTPMITVPIAPKQSFSIQVHSPDANNSTPPTGRIKFLGFTVARGRFINAYF